MGGGHSARDVNAAVQQGVARCRQSAAPIVTLAQYVGELQAQQGWNDADILQVETAIRRILARILDDSPWPADEG